MEVGKVVVPTFAVLFAYLAYRHGKEKDKQAEEKRINNYKEFILLTLKLLQQGVKHQTDLINEFIKQLKDENTLIAKLSISPDFHITLSLLHPVCLRLFFVLIIIYNLS